MAKVTWDNSLSVNVKEIDEQHKRLIAMLNELSDAMAAGKGKEVLGKILNGLVSYTASHFQTEEKYFNTYSYPDSVNHKKEHEGFVKKARELKQGFDSGKFVMTAEVMTFIGDWIKNHIKVADKKYSAFFNEKGLK